MLYYFRRSLVTSDEVRERLHSISVNEEFRARRPFIANNNLSALTEAHRFLKASKVLKVLRKHIGAHVDPTKVVRSSIKYFGPSSVSRIGWTDTQSDFVIDLDFATHILEGAIGSHLGGLPDLPDEMQRLFQVTVQAFKHVQRATFVLIKIFLWDEFGAEAVSHVELAVKLAAPRSAVRQRDNHRVTT